MAHDDEKLKGLAVICSPVQPETKIIINALDVAMVFTIGDSPAPKGRDFFLSMVNYPAINHNTNRLPHTTTNFAFPKAATAGLSTAFFKKFRSPQVCQKALEKKFVFRNPATSSFYFSVPPAGLPAGIFLKNQLPQVCGRIFSKKIVHCRSAINTFQNKTAPDRSARCPFYFSGLSAGLPNSFFN